MSKYPYNRIYKLMLDLGYQGFERIYLFNPKDNFTQDEWNSYSDEEKNLILLGKAKYYLEDYIQFSFE